MTALSQHTSADLRHLFDLACPTPDTPAAITALRDRHLRDRWHYLGFPVAYDLEFPATRKLLDVGFFNNISTEAHWPPGGQHAMEAEIAVLDWLSHLFGINPAHRWGYATTGGTGGNRAAIRRARALHPDTTVVYSTAVHYSIPRAARDFRMPCAQVPALPCGAIDLKQLDNTVGALVADRPDGAAAVTVVATLGTTVTEASDDLAGITAILDTHRVRRRYLHIDGALAGIPQALDDTVDLSRADSISISGYKFLAVPEACGIILGRGSDEPNDQVIAYTDTLNVTETGVRSGLCPAMMFEAIAQHGRDGHRARAHTSRALTDYTIDRLTSIGVPAWRNPNAYFTVVLPTPPAVVLAKWTLANDSSGSSHIVCVPGVTREQIDAFVNDLAAAMAVTPAPRQRRRHPAAVRP
ncbi:MAG: hypothetical protein QOI01_3337 [Mycobacterium sp.]|jgi:histidine decarboxylase|nr:hypothetical protein [Mycobacterium sp.]